MLDKFHGVLAGLGGRHCLRVVRRKELHQGGGQLFGRTSGSLGFQPVPLAVVNP